MTSELSTKKARPYPTAWARTWPVRGLRRLVQAGGVNALVRSMVTLDVHGLDQLAGFSEPALIVANHASHLDTGVLLCTLPSARRRRTAVAAAADYFFDTWWRAGGSAIAFNTFPIERARGTLSATPGRLLSSGWSVVVYPEGTRSPDGFLGRFKLGAAWLAVQHQVPVIPVGIRGTYAAMPRGKAWPVRGRPRVSVRYGPPIRPLPGETVRQLAPRIAAAVRALMAEDETSWWLARRGQTAPATADPPPGSWRRTWQQSEPPPVGGQLQRPAVWRR
ncbi:MAG TPA: lysophospholipid acyltransferase family protein [Propionibacteriaceae bacterium]|nr:lysophospholipid acyltransferase family protein [Propionibacteriaceae bacterium]